MKQAKLLLGLLALVALLGMPRWANACPS